jgi:glycosyltransferase involved in cell wall biosynthesis
MPESNDQPLVTFAVAAFNQERFIREAVEAAFAQTYSPLEIILSDDCSEDRTFAIMRDLAAAYRGPHQVLLNRNPARKSIGGHVNKIVEMSRGELILGAAGDDVSMPERTRLTYEAWEQSGRRATSIHSGFIQIDENGRVIEQIFKSECLGKAGSAVEQAVEPLAYVRTLDPCVFGCTHAWSRRLFTIFGGLPEQVIHEDNVLAFRSILGGRLVYINAPLVKYRLHGSNVFIKSRGRGMNLKSLELQEARVRRDFRNRETMYEAFLLDLEKAKSQALIKAVDFERVFKEADQRRRHLSLMGEFLESGFFRKCRILSTLRREGLDKMEARDLVLRLVPRPLLLRLRLVRNCAARALGRSS